MNSRGRFFKLSRQNSSNETSFPDWLAMEPPRNSLTDLLIGNDLQPLWMTFNARLSQHTNKQTNMDLRVFYLGNVSGPLGVPKIINYLIIIAFCILESFSMWLGMGYFTFRGNENLSTCWVGQKPSKGLSKPNQLVEIKSCFPTPTHEC